MQALKKILVFVSVIVFFNSLLLIALFWTANNTIAKREVVKSWIADSGVYDNIIDTVIDEVKKEVDKSSDPVSAENGSDIDIDVLTTAASSTFTSEVLRNVAETVLNGAYDWLEGSNAELAFVIDLSEQKAALADKLADEAVNTLNALPECTTVTQLLENRNLSPFDATCRPDVAGFEEQIDQFRNEFVNSEEFFPDPVINAADITIETDNGTQTISAALPEVPLWYQRAQKFVWFMIGLALLSLAGVVFASKNIRSGVKKSIGALIFASVILLTIGFLTQQSPDLLNVGDDTIQQTIAKPLADQITGSFAGYNYRFAAVYAFLAVAGFVYVYLSRPKAEEVEKEAPQDKSAAESPSTQESDSEESKTQEKSTVEEPVDKASKKSEN